jgi:maltose alpha-D-glucosyltransferase / alpha-amylase
MSRLLVMQATMLLISLRSLRATAFPGEHNRSDRYLPNFFPFQPALNYGFARPDPKEPWQLPTTDPACIAVREELKRVMKFWLDLGADGFRVDMAFSLVRNDPDNEAIGALWRYYRSWLDKEYPEAVLVSEWSDPAVAIPAGFHIDFLIQIGQPAYGILLGPLSWPNGYSRDPHAFFERAGGGDIKPFVENYLKNYTATKSRGYISMPTANHDIPRPTCGRDEQEVRTIFAMLLTMPGVPFIYYGDEIGMNFLYPAPDKEATGQRSNPFGDHPDGYLSYSPNGRMYSIVVMQNRPNPRDEDRLFSRRRSPINRGRARRRG